eukprot:14416516-Alexandrium_andersonii.AAC.1
MAVSCAWSAGFHGASAQESCRAAVVCFASARRRPSALRGEPTCSITAVSYTHLRAHETSAHL